MDSNADRDDWLDLADAIELLRDQVLEAQHRADGSALRFTLGEITVEFGVELAQTRGVGGGVRFGVAAVDAKGERTARSTHRVTVKLTPKLAIGGDVDVSDEEDE
jgi:hypothetical protein